MHKKYIRLLAYTCLLIVLGGCISTRGYNDRKPRVPAPVEDKVIIDGEVLPLPDEPSIRSERLPAAKQESAVVVGLLNKANQQSQIENWEGATNSLERALRLEPQNSVLWNRLAEVKKTQQEWQQAVQFAARSNSYVGENRDLKRANWFLMMQSYEALGNQEKAEKYKQKLSR